MAFRGEYAVNRVVSFFKTRSFAVLLFHVGVLLFNWPLLSLSNENGETSVFSYLLITWALIVVVLIVVGQSIKHSEETDRES